MELSSLTAVNSHIREYFTNKNTLRDNETMKKVSIFLIFLLLITSILSAQENKTPLKLPKTNKEISVDGSLDDPAWRQALELDLKYEVMPGDNTPAVVETKLYLIYTQTHLHIGFKCLDPRPEEIRAHFTDRDTEVGDDFVGIALDTFNDERRNYWFWSNANGVQEDAVMTVQGNYDTSWDTIYNSAGQRFEWGYSVEMAIPFSSLRFQNSDTTQVWGIDAWRNYPRTVLHRCGLIPQDRNNNCYQCQLLKIEGFEGVTPGRNIEIAPTMFAVKTDKRETMPDGDFVEDNSETEAGINAKWGITPNMTFNGTLNPDFSQVEADARQLDINQPFALFFQEKRPFFTEGADYFNTPLTAVYTRTMRNPSWGMKLTGKEGDHSVGAYVVRDDVTNLIFPGPSSSSQTSMNMESTAIVARYKKDFGRKYTFGALATAKEGDDYHNRVYGLDGRFRFTRTDMVEYQFLGSTTQYPDQIAADFGQEKDEFSDTAARIFYSHDTRNFSIFSLYENIGNGFRADLGFMPQVGYRLIFAGSNYNWIAEPGQWWTGFSVGARAYKSENQNGDLITEGGQLQANYQGLWQSNVFTNLIMEKENFMGHEYDLTYGSFNVNLRPSASMILRFNLDLGDRIDFANNRKGSRIRVNNEGIFSIGSHLRITAGHTFETMDVEDAELFTANISQGSVVYQFDNRMFVRAILQYVDYSYNVDNYLFPREPELKQLFSQILFSYKINPQTVLFLGYTDNYHGNQYYDLTQSDRTFFAKIGYAWQL